MTRRHLRFTRVQDQARQGSNRHDYGRKKDQRNNQQVKIEKSVQRVAEGKKQERNERPQKVDKRKFVILG